MTEISTAFQISSVPTRPKAKPTIQIYTVSVWQKSGLQFVYPLFLLDTNRDCCSNILCSRPRTKTTIQISSVSTWQKSGLLFKYPLFLPNTNRDCYLDIRVLT